MRQRLGAKLECYQFLLHFPAAAAAVVDSAERSRQAARALTRSKGLAQVMMPRTAINASRPS